MSAHKFDMAGKRFGYEKCVGPSPDPQRQGLLAAAWLFSKPRFSTATMLPLWWHSLLSFCPQSSLVYGSYFPCVLPLLRGLDLLVLPRSSPLLLGAFLLNLVQPGFSGNSYQRLNWSRHIYVSTIACRRILWMVVNYPIILWTLTVLDNVRCINDLKLLSVRIK